jgi:hypothetical protein
MFVRVSKCHKGLHLTSLRKTKKQPFFINKSLTINGCNIIYPNLCIPFIEKFLGH